MKLKINIINRFLILLTAFVILSPEGSYAQKKVGIKTNALSWATATPNVSFELELEQRKTLDLYIAINPWEFRNDKKIKHYVVQPELRFYNKETLNGSFWGVNTLFTHFNAGGVKLPLGMFKNLQNHRYYGWGVGVGASYGYVWNLSQRLGLEATAGLGYIYFDYKKYDCGVCGEPSGNGNKHYFGPTKLGISLTYKL